MSYVLDRSAWWSLLLGWSGLFAGAFLTLAVEIAAAPNPVAPPDWLRVTLGLSVLGAFGGPLLLAATAILGALTHAPQVPAPRVVTRFLDWYYASPPPRPAPPIQKAASAGNSSTGFWIAIAIIVAFFLLWR